MDENTIVVVESKLDIPHKASDIFADIELVPLETTDECLMSDVDKIVVAGDTIYLMDSRAKSILMFDRKGKFLSKIHRWGRGPGEYLTLDDFTVTRSGQIIVIDGEHMKLLFFDRDGGYISQKRLPFYVDAVECVDDRVAVFNGSSDNDRVIIWDMEKEEILGSHIPFDSIYSARLISSARSLSKYGNEIYYQKENSSEIYSVGDGKLNRKWLVDFGGRNIDLEKIKTVIFPEFGEIVLYMHPSHVAEMISFDETDNYIHFRFQCGELDEEYAYSAYCSKTTGEQIFINPRHYDDDMVFAKYPPDVGSTTADGRFVDYIMPVYLLQHMATYSPEKMEGAELARWNAQQERLKNVQPSDNPVIMFYTLKDF